MIAEWDVNKTAAMTEEQNLRNLCQRPNLKGAPDYGDKI